MISSISKQPGDKKVKEQKNKIGIIPKAKVTLAPPIRLLGSCIRVARRKWKPKTPGEVQIKDVDKTW
jgi:hypothetical protein